MVGVYCFDFLRSRLSQLLYALPAPSLLVFAIALLPIGTVRAMYEQPQDDDSRAVVSIKEDNATPDAQARSVYSPAHSRERTFVRSSSHASLSAAQAEKIELAIRREERPSAQDTRAVVRAASAQSAHSADNRRGAVSLLGMRVSVDEVLSGRESSGASGGVASKKNSAIESAQAVLTQEYNNQEEDMTGSAFYNTDDLSLFGLHEDPVLATQKFHTVGDEVLAMLRSKEYQYSPEELAAVCSSLENAGDPAMRFFKVEPPVHKEVRHRRVNMQAMHALHYGSRVPASEEKDNERDAASFNGNDQSMHKEVLMALLRELNKKDRREKIEAQKAKAISHQLLVDHRKESKKREKLDHVAKLVTGLVAAGIGAWATKCQSGK